MHTGNLHYWLSLPEDVSEILQRASIRYWGSAEAIAREYVAPFLDDYRRGGFEGDWKAIEIELHPGDPILTARELIARAEHFGAWGCARPDGNLVEMWFHPRFPLEKRLVMLAHELTHLVEAELDFQDPAKLEDSCSTVGLIAALSLREAMGISLD